MAPANHSPTPAGDCVRYTPVPSKKFNIVGLGEILWDMFPAGKQLGGAPANFAYMCNLLGDRGIVASRVGADTLGNEIIQHLTDVGLETTYLQVDATHPTGTVLVHVDQQGQPSYQITQNVAWDYLHWDHLYESLARQVDAVCFGTLAQRSPHSRVTVRRFLESVPARTLKVFDVNFRQEFYSTEAVAESTDFADILKVNEFELPRLASMLGIAYKDEESCTHKLLEGHPLRLVCVTRGDRGSRLVSPDGGDQHPGFCVPIVDAVGAGDAFTAALVHFFLRGASLAEMNVAANILGSWVVGKPGAMPAADAALLEKIRAIGN
ncbi:MAG: carbohydrate kinase [Candidatus Acidiferrum sp.]